MTKELHYDKDFDSKLIKLQNKKLHYRSSCSQVFLKIGVRNIQK